MSLFKHTINYSDSTGSRVNGIYQEGSGTPKTFLGTVQPLNDLEVRNLDIGADSQGAVKIYSDRRLNIQIKEQNQDGSIVTWQGQLWQCIKEKIYQNGLIPHYKYFAVYYGEVP